MIRDEKRWRQFERELARRQDLTIEQKYKILNALLQEAINLGVFPPKDPLEGIETKIKVAKIINGL